jgi:hypothetical protein
MNLEAPASIRVVFNRRILIVVYSTLAIVSVFVFISQINLSPNAFASSFVGFGPILLALPAILPFAFAGIYAWQLISERRLGLYLFLVASALGTLAANAAILGVFGRGSMLGLCSGT